jgi:hypothetical protein
MGIIQLFLFIVFVAVPAWLMNRWLLRVLRPRESFLKFLSYMLISLAAAFLYTFIFVWALLYLQRPH